MNRFTLGEQVFPSVPSILPAIFWRLSVDKRASKVHSSEKGFTLVTFGQDMSVQASNRGFTIFELMITVAIAAVLAAFAIPGFQDLMARNRINATAEQVATSLASARTTAVTQRRPVVMKPDVDANGWVMFLDCSSCTTSQRIESNQIQAPMVLSLVSTPAGTVTEATLQPSGVVKRTLPAPVVPLDLTVRICDSSIADEVGKDVTITRVGKITSRLHADKSTCNP